MEKIELKCGGKDIVIETGLLAKQAHGSALVTCGDTVVLVTAVSQERKEPSDFFPLTCDYREQVSAAGKIPGGFFKREGRPTERETLISRLTDRSIRPLFPDDFRDEAQVVSQVLSADQENDPDILSIIGASAALTLTRMPFLGPIGAVKIGCIDGNLVVNPTISQLSNSTLGLIVVGTDTSLIMLEGWAKEISGEVFLAAAKLGFESIQPVVEKLKTWKQKHHYVPAYVIEPETDGLVKEFILSRIAEIHKYPGKHERSEFYKKLLEELEAKFPEDQKFKIKTAYEKNLEQIIRTIIVQENRRLDGRHPEQIRELDCKVGLLPRTHGSALFTRGQTQCLSTLTLGTGVDEQRIDGLYPEITKKFMLHYNFPSYSVGEVSPNRGPSRREIGHGALAERSLSSLIPAAEVFPYTIRIVANILESNGSSSMATVCASSLSMMDGGVPIPRHVAGIALGMIKEGKNFVLLTDIAGEEDHYGDLDLKLAGTELGITGFQMDVKTLEFSWEILEKTVAQGRKAHHEILEKMNATIAAPRKEISLYAPKIMNIKINPEKIGAVIGPGGKMIRKIIEETGAEIDIEDSGIVAISSPDLASCEKAVQRIREIVEEPEIGKIYTGKVVKIFAFGAMVEFLSNSDGLIHISELAPYRANRVEDVVHVGSEVKVKLIDIDDQGRNNLSRKQAMTPEEIEKEKAAHHQHAPQAPHSHTTHTKKP